MRCRIRYSAVRQLAPKLDPAGIEVLRWTAGTEYELINQSINVQAFRLKLHFYLETYAVKLIEYIHSISLLLFHN